MLVILALAGCGDSAERRGDRGRQGFAKVTSAVDGLTGPARERKLLELAKAEGSGLSVYTSLTSKTATAVADAFEDAYPEIEVSVYRATSEAVAERVAQEARASFAGADAVETGGTEMVGLARQGVFVPYRPQGLSRLAPGSIHAGWTATRFTKFVVSWNTRLVSAGQRPTSWKDLADPRWRGRLALEAGDADWYKSLRDYWVAEKGMSPAQADRLFERIVRNTRVVESHNVMAQLLGAGEYAAAASNYLHLARDSRERGAPVAFVPLVEPIVSRAQGIGVLETARHPAAAILYVDWISGEGQEVLKRNNVEPVRRDLVDDLGAREVRVDVEEFVAQLPEWRHRYDELLRSGRGAPNTG